MLQKNVLFAIIGAFAFVGVTAVAADAKSLQVQSRNQRAQTFASENRPWRRVEVVGVNLSERRVTIRHIALAELGMPAMTMDFFAARGSHVAMLRLGDHVDVQIVADNKGSIVGGRIVGFRMMHGSGDLFT